MKGSVKTVGRPGDANPTFGFIRGADKIDRFFLPGGMIQPVARELRDLRPGDEVEFEHEDSPRGPRAVRVRVMVASSSTAWA